MLVKCWSCKCGHEVEREPDELTKCKLCGRVGCWMKSPPVSDGGYAVMEYKTKLIFDDTDPKP